MRKHHAYDASKFKNMSMQSPLNTRSQVTIFLNTSRRSVANRLPSSDIGMNVTPVNIINLQINDSANDMRALPL